MFLREHSSGPKQSISTIARAIGCADNTVRHWLRVHKETGDVVGEVKHTRTRKLDEEEVDHLVALLEKKREATLDELVQHEAQRGVEVSPTTLSRRLKERGYGKRRPMSKPLLTDAHKKARLAWARQHQRTNWNRVLFTDETTMKFWRPVRMVWRRRGEAVLHRTVKHPKKVHLWGCFSANGFGRIYMFEQNLNSQLLKKIYNKALLPSAKNLFAGQTDHWSLQEDNDPKHRSALARQWREDHNIDRISWPSLSPDLNPIENVWSILKANVAARRAKTVQGFRRAIAQEWKNLPTELAQKLADSMKRRVAAVIAVDGDHVLY